MSVLRQKDDDELLYYLLQLVQVGGTTWGGAWQTHGGAYGWGEDMREGGGVCRPEA